MFLFFLGALLHLFAFLGLWYFDVLKDVDRIFLHLVFLGLAVFIAGSFEVFIIFLQNKKMKLNLKGDLIFSLFGRNFLIWIGLTTLVIWQWKIPDSMLSAIGYSMANYLGASALLGIFRLLFREIS